ncbi:unnamed protein product [Peronospora belbahrii]|uniref:Integrase catalytic domain-containing protein n=1 Tax=Peronospora belbahrii TaxID=622444 RepID=A0ABN8CRQ1_9STRA|nr:unnamed protein product [Peronospora belbahrii]
MLELVHTDVMGPMRTLTKGGAKYVLMLVDDSSRLGNGTEFVNKTVDEMFHRNGILHQRTVSYSPQQNGVAERMNRTIVEKARHATL